MMRKLKQFISIVFLISFIAPAHADDLLHGEVTKQDELLRINRPDTNNNSNPLQGENPIPVAPSRFQGKLVDTGAFSAPLNGNAQKDAGQNGQAQYGTIPASQFDLGADRNSRELVLAWERWHHQLSQAIYTRWSQFCNAAGTADVRLTITRDRNIQAVMLHSSGNPEFDRTLLQAIFSLSGNAGLTFPSQSQRQQVTLDSEYVAGHNVNPGFSWVKNDYEKVQQSY